MGRGPMPCGALFRGMLLHVAACAVFLCAMPCSHTALADMEEGCGDGRLGFFFYVQGCPGPESPAGDDGDADGLSDAWEMTHFACLDLDGSDDPDGDGLVNSSEEALGADPNAADSDADGVPDGADSSPIAAANTDGDSLPDDWENFLLGGLAHNGDGDPDGDGTLNADECAMRLDPLAAGTPDTLNITLLTVTRPAA